MKHLPEQRCPTCNKLLYRGYPMRIQIKCARCKSIVFHEILEMKQDINEHRNRIKNTPDQ
jgi:phage FluMu protein Com